ncbi:aminoglycoside phosphotransferase family protein [Microbacterium sp. M28]|uniref:aminoglycoside phosphotransferase family protein n=1 Tax=Microbacterium sp. M28 TaxID=2962064 RepID=UPI0021F4AC7D|nr:aminoglycoside phosphotransferase family protein [Microbacterium sp. M28]UYO98418.1 aminoglycoside phosphotransferase family protein [Microbacterium sp. M28]
MADSPAAERSLEEDDVRALLRRDARHLADLPLALVSDGWDNTMWRLGADLAVRIPRRELAAGLIQHEQRALPELGPRLATLGLRTPIPLVCGRPSEVFPWPWSVVPWIDGTSAFGTSRADNARWASRLAEALRLLHQPAPNDAPHNPVRGVPLIERDDVMRARLAEHSELGALHDAWDAGLAAPPSTERVWIHGDLHPGNILVRHGALTALIDFGDATAGDPAYDLAVAWLLFDAEGRELFRRATRDRYDDATWTRAHAWAAYLALVFLTLSDDRPDHLALGRSTITELTSERPGPGQP